MVRATCLMLSALLVITSAVIPAGAQEAAVAAVIPDTGAELPVEAVPVDPEPEPTPPRPGLTRTDLLWASRLCAHEATWAGRVDGTADCGGIVQVILNRMVEHEARVQECEAEGRDGCGGPETFTQRLSYTSPRFWAGTTTRSWARLLPAGPIRGVLAGWPADWPAPSNYTARWHSVYTHTHAYMSGREALPCDGTPTHWLGRRTDHDRLQEWLDSGDWREVTCVGEGDLQERNAFLERAPTETTEDEPAPEVVVAPEEAEVVLGG